MAVLELLREAEDCVVDLPEVVEAVVGLRTASVPDTVPHSANLRTETNSVISFSKRIMSYSNFNL